MRKALWVIAVALAAALSPVLQADTTYTVNQTFNVDGGTIGGDCNPLRFDCSASTAYITGTITTDGSTGLLSSSDIIGVSLADDAGSYSGGVNVGVNGYPSGTNFSGLYAYDSGLFFVGAQGGSFLGVIGNGFFVNESVSPGSPVLDFLVGMGDGVGVTGSTTLSNGLVTIATVTSEPGTAVLCFLGLAFIVVLRKRRFTGPWSVQVSEM